MTILITGGSGFIGSNFIEYFLEMENEEIVNIDSLTYAGSSNNSFQFENNKKYKFIKLNINEKDELKRIFNLYKPRAIINFAAESHVDRSISGPGVFIDTNILGVYNLLEVSRGYWLTLKRAAKENFRFIQISTDEVYGSLMPNDQPSSELSPYKPNSPYSASKASSDHLVRAWNKTYGLPTIITNCTNNFGPYQYPEKLIPIIILSAINHRQIPIYGNGQQIRDWIYVKDHCNGILLLLKNGKKGETYNIGNDNEISNIELIKKVCANLDDLVPNKNFKYYSLANHVDDRPGHDQRYSIDSSKIKKLGWKAEIKFETALIKTIKWYLDNNDWINSIKK